MLLPKMFSHSGDYTKSANKKIVAMRNHTISTSTRKDKANPQ